MPSPSLCSTRKPTNVNVLLKHKRTLFSFSRRHNRCWTWEFLYKEPIQSVIHFIPKRLWDYRACMYVCMYERTCVCISTLDWLCTQCCRRMQRGEIVYVGWVFRFVVEGYVWMMRLVWESACAGLLWWLLLLSLLSQSPPLSFLLFICLMHVKVLRKGIPNIVHEYFEGKEYTSTSTLTRTHINVRTNINKSHPTNHPHLSSCSSSSW